MAGRIVLPTPEALALRYRRQHADVQPTDGMANYGMKDLALGMALAEKGAEMAFPIGSAIHKATVRDPNQLAAMNAARQRIGVEEAGAHLLGADPPVAVPSMADGSAATPLRTEYESVLTRPNFIRRGLPTVVAPPLVADQRPAQEPAQRDRPGALPGGTVSAPGAVVERPEVEQQELPPMVAPVSVPQQGASAVSQLPQAPVVNFNPQDVLPMNQLSTLVQAARATGDPVQMASVAQFIDAQPMEDAEPQGWGDIFTGNHKTRARETLKAQLGLGATAGASDPLKRMDLERKILDSEAMRPGRQAESQVKQVAASGAERRASQEEASRDLANQVAQLDAMVKQASVPRAQAEAVLAQLEARYGRESLLAAIRLKNASASRASAQAQTENQLRDEREEQLVANTRRAYIQGDDVQATRLGRIAQTEASTGLTQARTSTEEVLRQPRRRELIERAGMESRSPAGVQTSGFRSRQDIDKEIARLRGDLAGADQFLSANPAPENMQQSAQQMRAQARAAGSVRGGRGQQEQVAAARRAAQSKRSEIMRTIEELSKLRAALPDVSVTTTTVTPRTP